MDGITFVVIGALALVPCAVLLIVRRGQPEHPSHASVARLAAMALMQSIVLVGAYRLDGLPLSLAIVGLLLALLGLGIGVRSLYRFIYGPAWLAAHPGVERRDIDNWQRLTLIGAVIFLVLALVAALSGADVAAALLSAPAGGLRSE